MQLDKQPGNMRKLLDMELEMEIKCKTLKKLDLELQIMEIQIERAVNYSHDYSAHCNHDINYIVTDTVKWNCNLGR